MFEPYRIKVVEPIPIVSKAKREKVLKEAGYNPFFISANCVTIDLISDSGTSAMSTGQWSEIIEAREDFSGQEANEEFLKTAREITGFSYIQSVHQGRSAENILFKMLLKPGDIVVSNTHFETTRDNIEELGCEAVDIPKPDPPFYGNIDLDRLAKILKKRKKVKMVVMTISNNIKGGQPISLDNISKTKNITRSYGILLVFDASRFADNAYLIKRYTKSNESIKNLCLRMFRFADILYLSSKKDGLVNIGGFIGLRERKFFDRLAFEIIRQESYPSSGGLAARDVAAMRVGLKESIDEDFLCSHIENVQYLGRILKENGVKIFEPVGGHGVVVIPKEVFPYAAFSLSAEIYSRTGIRVGVFADDVRLAIPRRVYTRGHLKYVGESIAKIYGNKLIKLKLVNRPKRFFNFFARFKKI